MRPCVRCLSEKYKRIRRPDFMIIQCEDCSFNVTGQSWEHTEKLWNEFKVWNLLEQTRRQSYGSPY